MIFNNLVIQNYNRTMKYITLALFLFTIHHNLNAQAETYETFDFIYIDNSQTTAEDGLSQEQINIIEMRAAEIAENNGQLLIIYASNDNNPKITTDAKNVSTWLNNLLQNDAPFPGDKFAEKKFVREALYSSSFDVNRQVNFHFFITDQYATSLQNQPSAMISMLVNEFVQTLNFKGDVIANIYINNRQSRKLNISEIQKTLEYNNPFEPISLGVIYKIVDLKL